MSLPQNQFGHVDELNNVFVLDGGEQRKVGQYPGVEPAAALAYFVRKYDDLAAQVRLLEQRVAKQVEPSSLGKAFAKLQADLAEPNAVGDLADLRARILALAPKIQQFVQEKAEANKELAAKALAEREAIAAKAEAIAEKITGRINWKDSSGKFDALFNEWQRLQKDGPKVSKSQADAIWRRFSTARTKFETARRHFFANLDATNKDAKIKRQALVKAAESLVAKGGDAATEYRELLDQWKEAARGPVKGEDELWNRFKAAGDAIYAARGEQMAAENAEFAANLATKMELLKEAEKIDPKAGVEAARAALREVAAKWEQAGKVSRDKMRELEDRMRAVEKKVKAAEDEEWRKTDPAVIDRNNAVLSQLHASIEKLEQELAAAKASKNAKKESEAAAALEARKAWLAVVQAGAN